MELNQFSTVDIVLDKANDNFIQKQSVSAGDRDGRSLTVQITDAGVVGEVPGLTLNLLWKNHASGVTDLSAFYIIDQTTSTFRFDYPQNMLTPGKVTANIVILHSGKTTHAREFEIIVTNLAGQIKGVLQTAEYTALVEALAKTNGFEGDIRELEIKKAEKLYVEDRINNITQGGPGDTLSSVAELLSKYPNGLNKPVVVKEPAPNEKKGYIYTWTNDAWKKGILYQEAGLSERQVKNEHIDFTAIAQENIDTNFSNIFNKNTAVKGRYILKNNGFIYSPAWSTSDYIAVEFGDIISINEGFSAVAVGFNNDDERIWEFVLPGGVPVGKTSFTIPVNVSKIILNVLVANIDTYVATKNRELPDVYMPHRKTTLDWLDLEDKSVAQRHLSDDVFYRESSWSGKNAQWYGDSISWQDGKVYTGTSNVAKGYQTLLKAALHFSNIDNLAISGRPIADGTPNGAGTVSTIISSYTSSDLVVVAGGTNDFKLNVPIGEFDSTSKNEFYGALHAIAKHVLTLTPNQIIIFMAPLQRDSAGYDVDFTNSAGHKLFDYVNAIKDICDYYSLPFFDGYRKSGITKLNLGVNTLDGLHLNDVGYKKVSKTLIPFFDTVRGD